MLSKALALLVFMLLIEAYLFHVENEREKEKDDVFVPTSEWQTVKKGQAIPRGLHVRMNINKGETEAKLLDPHDSETLNEKRTDVLALPQDDDSTNENDISPSYMSKSELKKVLAQVNGGLGLGEDSSLDEAENKLKQKYRSYDELKKEFSDLNLAVKTDVELLSELIANAKEFLNRNDESIVSILTDLEYLVHQIDNAQEFVRINGFTDVVLPALNSTSSKVRAEALWLVGSAVQSNPKVQIAALNVGCIQKLLRAVALDKDETVRSRGVYALSCLTRRFPAAQLKLVEEGGLATLGSVYDNDHTHDIRTKMKIVTLINDLIEEQKDVESSLKESKFEASNSTNNTEIDKAIEQLKRLQREELSEKLRQYQAVNLEKHLLEGGWCLRFPQLLIKLQGDGANADRAQRRDDLGSVMSSSFPFRPQHDVIEKVTEAMVAMSHICLKQFRSHEELNSVLSQLVVWYEDLSIREEVLHKTADESRKESCHSGVCSSEDSATGELDQYYTSMTKMLRQLLRILEPPTEAPFKRKEEL